MILFISLCAAFTVFYTILMLYYALGWRKLKVFSPSSEFKPLTHVSVIVPARNEEENISNILECIIKQNYPKELLDIIVVDDASSDNTAAIVKQYEPQGIRLLQQKHSIEKIAYKKNAIDYAISQSNGTFILTTDADCIVQENWVRTIVAYRDRHDACFVSSPVAMDPFPSIFQKLQALEFAGLVGIGGAALARGYPNMCNGANVAYLKDAYYAVNGFKGNDDIPSGDDEFLMHKMFAAFPARVMFLKSQDVIVYTEPAQTLSEFIQQRMRWVSKSTKYENKLITIILALCYLFNLSLLVNFIGMFFYPLFLTLFLVQVLLKIIVEGILLLQVSSFLKVKKLMLWLIPEQLLHIVYVVVIGILGNVKGYKWKERNVSN